MMDSQRDLILKSFLAESGEGLGQMEQDILGLESRPEDGELIQSVFRVVHTMKGNACLLELQNLMVFAHALEDLLDAIRNGKLSVEPDIITLLLASLDVLRQMSAAAGQGVDETSQSATDMMARISYYLSSDSKKQANAAEDDSAVLAPETAPVLAGAARKETTRTLRVDVEKLDRLLNLVGEITIARGRMTQLLASKGDTTLEEIRDAHSFADALHLELRETILKTRMVPMGLLFRQYARTVRDLAKSHGKMAELQIEGEEVEVDTSIVEHLRDPLLHMVRNAVAHGIEPSTVRTRIGKPQAGTITVRAAHQGSNIRIEVSDDGAGLDRQGIIEAARRRGLAAELDKLSDHDIQQLIFEPGFSTASQVSELSGRGVGMDVVRRNVQALRGSVQITSQPGSGTTVHIQLPLTLAIIEGFAVGIGNETYVIPVDQVAECVKLPEEQNDLGRKEGILQLRDAPLPFLYLKDHFGLAGERSRRQSIVVVQHDANQVGLVVDALHGAMQTVIKPLPAIVKDVPGVSGSAILGSGRVALILDIPGLLRDFRAQGAEAL
jgi:two-component system, chemotaxis family, sensor kinase CheA